MDGSVYAGRSKLDELLGPNVWDAIGGKAVIDFGCGEGREVVELAQRGARFVVGIDNRPRALEAAQQLALNREVADKCGFTTDYDGLADVIISLDSFEHFHAPEEILFIMARMLAPGGCVLVSFGPTWYHPLGGHLFSVFPWAHLIFTEAALIRWRSGFKTDGATRFCEVEGGLNQMTIKRFEQIVAKSPLRFEFLRLVPIRVAWRFWSPLTREFLTSVVQCKLVHRN